jgi:hypothetical protein
MFYKYPKQKSNYVKLQQKLQVTHAEDEGEIESLHIVPNYDMSDRYCSIS